MEGQWSEAENPAPASYQQCLICPKCNFRSCRFRKSSTNKNPDRWFYSCPATDHTFFKWADEVKPHELIPVPYCGGCTAGLCRVRRVNGRILFTCRVKEGEGSCGYKVWQDELEMSEAGLAPEKMNMSPPIIKYCNKTTDIDMVKDSEYREEGTDTVSPLLDPSDDLLYSEVISEMAHEVIEEPNFLNEPETRSRKIDQLNCLESDIISIRPHKRSCYGDKAVTCPQEPTFLLQDIWVNSSGSVIPARHSGGAESYRKLSFNLKQHHNPIDSSFVVPDKILVNSSDAATLLRHRVMEAESYSKPFVTKGHRHSIMSNAFHQAAECLQNELISRLEAMDAKDHVAMSQAAEDTFAALDCLLFDHQDFKKCVKELIHCTSSLVEIEQSMPTSDSHQKLVEICSSERVKLDEISCVHTEAVEAVVNNAKSLKVMQEEISSTMDWLSQIKAKVRCCEVTMKNLESELEEVAKMKEVLERKYLIASKEVEESQKLLEQKEEEHNAAKAAFERARAMLRG